jgi:hypothetical protein
MKHCVNVIFDTTDSSLAKEGTSYNHTVYSKITRFDALLESLIHIISNETPKDTSLYEMQEFTCEIFKLIF